MNARGLLSDLQDETDGDVEEPRTLKKTFLVKPKDAKKKSKLAEKVWAIPGEAFRRPLNSPGSNVLAPGVGLTQCCSATKCLQRILLLSRFATVTGGLSGKSVRPHQDAKCSCVDTCRKPFTVTRQTLPAQFNMDSKLGVCQSSHVLPPLACFTRFCWSSTFQTIFGLEVEMSFYACTRGGHQSRSRHSGSTPFLKRSMVGVLAAALSNPSKQVVLLFPTTSTFCLYMCSQRLIKFVLQCQNQDALARSFSELGGIQTSQNGAPRVL